MTDWQNDGRTDWILEDASRIKYWPITWNLIWKKTQTYINKLDKRYCILDKKTNENKFVWFLCVAVGCSCKPSQMTVQIFELIDWLLLCNKNIEKLAHKLMIISTKKEDRKQDRKLSDARRDTYMGTHIATRNSSPLVAIHQ